MQRAQGVRVGVGVGVSVSVGVGAFPVIRTANAQFPEVPLWCTCAPPPPPFSPTPTPTPTTPGTERGGDKFPRQQVCPV